MNNAAKVRNIEVVVGVLWVHGVKVLQNYYSPHKSFCESPNKSHVSLNKVCSECEVAAKNDLSCRIVMIFTRRRTIFPDPPTKSVPLALGNHSTGPSESTSGV